LQSIVTFKYKLLFWSR